MREIRERGLRIPRDISITGFDNVNLAHFCYPALTTVHLPRDQIGQNICHVLLSNEAIDFDREILIDPELVLRDSTGLARQQ